MTNESMPTEAQAAFRVGARWLDEQLEGACDPNELARVALAVWPELDSLELVRACVPVAEAVQFVQACRMRGG